MKRPQIYTCKVQSKLTQYDWEKFDKEAKELNFNESEMVRDCIYKANHLKGALKIAADTITEKIDLNANQAKTIRELSDKLKTMTASCENSKLINADNIKLHGTVLKFETDLKHSRELNIDYLRTISKQANSLSIWKVATWALLTALFIFSVIIANLCS
tara:strand:+ start:930 stop:1406 length:477 start_codon:yes stop_codon:yes gene_type:complete